MNFRRKCCIILFRSSIDFDVIFCSRMWLFWSKIWLKIRNFLRIISLKVCTIFATMLSRSWAFSSILSRPRRYILCGWSLKFLCELVIFYLWVLKQFLRIYLQDLSEFLRFLWLHFVTVFDILWFRFVTIFDGFWLHFCYSFYNFVVTFCYRFWWFLVSILL